MTNTMILYVVWPNDTIKRMAVKPFSETHGHFSKYFRYNYEEKIVEVLSEVRMVQSQPTEFWRVVWQGCVFETVEEADKILVSRIDQSNFKLKGFKNELILL